MCVCVCVFTRLAQASIFSFMTLSHTFVCRRRNFAVISIMMQHLSVQPAEEEGSIGATGALATALGSNGFDFHVNANPLESAGPSSTGIPIISTHVDNAESLPAVEGAVPTSPATIRQKHSFTKLCMPGNGPLPMESGVWRHAIRIDLVHDGHVHCMLDKPSSHWSP